MTITIGAPVDALCPRCSADALVVTAVTDGQMSEIQCQECKVSYPDGADRGPMADDAPRKRERVVASAAAAPQAPQRGGTLLDVNAAMEEQRTKPKGHRRTGTLVDLEVDVERK